MMWEQTKYLQPGQRPTAWQSQSALGCHPRVDQTVRHGDPHSGLLEDPCFPASAPHHGNRQGVRVVPSSHDITQERVMKKHAAQFVGSLTLFSTGKRKYYLDRSV